MNKAFRKTSRFRGGYDAVRRSAGRAAAAVRLALYNLTVALARRIRPNGGTGKTINARKRNDMIFYCVMFAFPVAQFVVFYICVNVNSLLLAFKSYDVDVGYRLVGFANFAEAFRRLTHEYELIQSAINSLIVYAIGLFVGMPLSLLFSFYIYKKMPMHNLFKIVLFLPSIISAIAMAVIFNYFAERVIPEVVNKIFRTEMQGLFANPKTTFGTLVFYSLWIGFGTGIIMYSGAMNSISDSVVEAAKLEGASPMREFFSITLPLIWPTLVTFLVVGVAGIFTNQLNLFSFFGERAEFRLYTFGYYLFRNTQGAEYSAYPFLSSLGMLMTVVAVPVTLLVKYLLEKFGPSVD